MLTGKQLKTIRQVADFTGIEIADEMFVTKQSISAIETGKTTAKSSIHYYELTLKSMVERISDFELRSVCQVLFDKYSKINGDDEDFPVIDMIDESSDMDDAWYVMVTYSDGTRGVEYKSLEREKAIDYARDLKQHKSYSYENIEVYHDFDY